jgi:hypothetical protein
MDLGQRTVERGDALSWSIRQSRGVTVSISLRLDLVTNHVSEVLEIVTRWWKEGERATRHKMHSLGVMILQTEYLRPPGLGM